jgi:hypothetical protein
MNKLINKKQKTNRVENVAWREGEEKGRTYLHSLGYKEIYFRCFGGHFSPTPFDFTSQEGVFEIKTKKLPSSQPYTFDFTPYQIMFFKKYFSKEYKTNNKTRQETNDFLERYFERIDRYHYRKKKTTPYKACLKKYHFKIKFCKVIINLIFPDGHNEIRMLDMRTDFTDIERDMEITYNKKSFGLNQIRLSVKKEKRDW